jgi:hypothetical protein
MRLKNVTTTEFDIPSLRVTVAPGGEFECPDELAGEAPGTWREPTAAEIAEGCRGLVKRVEDGKREVLSPGAGLLGSGNYEPVGAKKVPAGKKTATTTAPINTEKEGAD